MKDAVLQEMMKFRNKINFDSCRKSTCFGSTYNKIGMIQRRLAWPLRKDDTQNREAFHIFWLHHLYLSTGAIRFDVSFSKS